MTCPARVVCTVRAPQVECYGNKCWSAIADQLPGRVAKQCRERYPEACAPPLPPPSPTQPPHRRCPVSRPAFCLFLSTHQAPSAERARRWLKQVCPSVNNEEWTDAEENRVVELVICPPPRPLLGPIGQLSSLLGPTVAWIQELSSSFFSTRTRTRTLFLVCRCRPWGPSGPRSPRCSPAARTTRSRTGGTRGCAASCGSNSRSR